MRPTARSRPHFFPEGDLFLQLDFRPQHLEKFGKPFGVSRPGRSGNQIAVCMSLIYRDIHIIASGTGDIGTDCRVGRTAFAFNDTGSGQHLGTVAYGSNGFVCFGKMADYIQDGLV